MTNFTYTGIVPGTLYISPLDEDGNILIQRNYELIHDNRSVTIGTQVLTRNLKFATLPTSVKKFLVDLSKWSENEIKVDLGLT